MLVPLTARGETLGVIGFAVSESNRAYGDSDLTLAEEHAARPIVVHDLESARAGKAGQQLDDRRHFYKL